MRGQGLFDNNNIYYISLNQINIWTVDKFRPILQYTVIFQKYSETIKRKSFIHKSDWAIKLMYTSWVVHSV